MLSRSTQLWAKSVLQKQDAVGKLVFDPRRYWRCYKWGYESLLRGVSQVYNIGPFSLVGDSEKGNQLMISQGHGLQIEGQGTSMSHFRRYVMSLWTCYQVGWKLASTNIPVHRHRNSPWTPRRRFPPHRCWIGLTLPRDAPPHFHQPRHHFQRAHDAPGRGGGQSGLASEEKCWNPLGHVHDGQTGEGDGETIAGTEWEDRRG